MWLIEALRWIAWGIALLGLWTLVGFSVALLVGPVLARRSREQARAEWNWSGDEEDDAA